MPTNAQMFRYGFYLLGGGVALGWLLWSQTARQFEHSKDATRSMVLAIVYLFLGITSGYLVFFGCLNRLRYPLLRDLSKSWADKSVPGAGKHAPDSVPKDC